MMYASPALLQDAAMGITGREKGAPFFPDPIILDKDLAEGFLKLHVALHGTAARLEQDSRLLSVLARFVLRHAEDAPRRGTREKSTGP